MHKSVKNMLFGAVGAIVVAGAFTATAKTARAAEVCEACEEGVLSGYLVATGYGTECVDASDERYVAQCGGGGNIEK